MKPLKKLFQFNNMEEFLVTVIIPFYNEEIYLKNAVNSVLSQSYATIEIVLVNDGSTDNSEKIATNICKENTSCKLITIKNNGPGNARNIGLENVNGKFVAFLDADDELEEFAIAILVENVIQKKVDLSIAMHTMLDSKKQYLKSSSWNNKDVIDANKAILYILKNELIPTVWGKLFKTKLAKQCKFPLKTWKEDDVFLLQYLKLSLKVAIINKSIIRINCRTNSLTRQVVSVKMMKDFLYSYKEQLNIIIPNKKLEKELTISYLHTLLYLFLIIKIDWNAIKDRIIVLTEFENQVNKLHHSSKKQVINFKQKVLFKLLNSTKVVGWRMPLFIIGLLKQKQLKALKKIKS